MAGVRHTKKNDDSGTFHTPSGQRFRVVSPDDLNRDESEQQAAHDTAAAEDDKRE